MNHTFELIRFSHTIFAMPFALASMFVAADGLPSLRTLLLIVLCMVFARTSAMAFNRFIDADIDARNPRTRNRHIPRGSLSKSYVMALALANGLAFIAAAQFLNSLAATLSPLALGIVWFYSVTKRWTHVTQLFLGLALAISPIGAWIAVTGAMAWPPVFLGGAVAFWVAGFDIFYATQDHEFDQDNQVKSLVVKLGIPGALKLARLFHLLTVILLLAFSFFVPMRSIYLLTCAIVAGLLVYEHSLVKADDLSRVDEAFFSLNGWIGMIFLVGTAAAVWVD